MRPPKHTPDPTAHVAARALVIVIVGVLVYANSLSGPFFFDDYSSIVENGSIRSLDTVLLERRDSPFAGRPVVGYSIALNYQLSGLEVTGYHLVNVAIHIGCALLLFGIVRRTFRTKRVAGRFSSHGLNLAMAIALLWIVHPLNTEAVNYVTQRTESLMALFYLATLYASIRGAESNSYAWPAAAVGFCALGMGCKESMATAPIIVGLYDRVFLFDSFSESFRRRWKLYSALAATWAVLAYLIVGGPRSGSAGFWAGVDSWTYLKNQSRMIIRYLRLAAWPSDLAVEYGPPEPISFAAVWPYAVAIVGLLALVAIACVRAPELAFAGAWFFITLAPASSIIPIATEVGAERRMYLPLMALSTLLVIAVAEACRRFGDERTVKSLGSVLLIAATAVLGAATFSRNGVYSSPLELAQTNLAHWPSDVAHGAVGSELQRLQRDAEAIPELRLGARTNPRSMYNLAVALFNNRQFEEAIQALDPLITRFPMREEVPWAHKMRGRAYLMMKQWPQAISELRIALSMTPRDTEIHTLLASTYASEGLELTEKQQFRQAASSFREGLAQEPGDIGLRYNLAAALIDAGDLDGGLSEARAIVERDARHADSYVLIGRALAMQGRLAEAVQPLQQAATLRPDDTAIRDDLARVLAALGNR